MCAKGRRVHTKAMIRSDKRLMSKMFLISMIDRLCELVEAGRDGWVYSSLVVLNLLEEASPFNSTPPHSKNKSSPYSGEREEKMSVHQNPPHH